MALPRPARPAALWQDIRAFVATRQRHQILFALISLAIPAFLVWGFYHDANIQPPPGGPIYVESWPADRTDAQIEAQQKIDQKARDEAFEARRKVWQRLKDGMGNL